MSTTAHHNTDALLQRIDQLTSAVSHMASLIGSRLSREQLANRLGVTTRTVYNMRLTDPSFPKPDTNGKWLLSEVVEWEQACQQRHR